ncbi:MAG TPA: DUF4272 domain-containing protein [Thermomicrobiales bacterium]|nr:DUF4272 domain-containing protein [Thermomicrobiales bacterium]
MSGQPPVPASAPDDDSVDINPRPAALVARRATLIASLLRRVGIEIGVVGADDALAERFDLAAWTAAEGLPALATEAEAATFAAPLGALDPLLIEDATWDAEALVALAWALGLISPMPPYDAIANPLAALSAMPLPWDSIAQFARSAKLRPETELAKERERAEVWRWRALTEMAKRDAPAATRPKLETAMNQFSREAAAAGFIAETKDDDFPVGHRPYRRISDEQLDDLAEIARQRLHALNWCCGFGDSWQDEEALDVTWPRGE